MSLSLYPQIKINSVYLTDGGTNGATPYIAFVRGLDALAVDSSIQAIKALDGTPYIQIAAMKGQPITVEVPLMIKADYDSIVAIVQAYITSGTAISADITGGSYGNFTSLALVPDGNPIEHSGEFQNGKLKNVKFRFLTT